MKGIKEAFIDAGEISQMLGIGMTKAYAIIKEYNAELEAKGYFTMRGKCPRKYFEQKIYGYEDYYNPDYEPQRNRSKVAEEMDYETAVVNPKPPTALEAVLTSLFKNYIHFSNSKLIVEDIADGE